MSKRKLVIVGNWKMNKTLSEAKKFFTEFKKLYMKNETKISKSLKFGLAVPSIDIKIAKENKIKSSMIIASQDIHHNLSGAYTGDLSAPMVKSAGANSVVIGHSERREYHGETDQVVNSKTKVALEHKLLPIVCIGETLEERKAKKWKSVLNKQIKGALKDLKPEEVVKVVIAYEPIWAIGTGVTATSEEAEAACKHIRNRIALETDELTSSKVIIQYGGSVKPENVKELMEKENIDGALVGGASLDPNSFLKLLTLNE